MGMFLGVVGFVAFFMFLVLTIISKVKRDGKVKRYAKGILAGFLIFCIGIFLTPFQSKDMAKVRKTENKNVAAVQVGEKSKLQESKSLEKDKKDEISDKTETVLVEKTTKGSMKVHYINVGQADSILIQQNGHNMLIDAGNNGDGELIKNYLASQGVDNLEFLVGTHPHEDHIGGMDYIINCLKIGKIYMPKVTTNTKTFKDVVLSAQKKGLKLTTPTVGTNFKLGEATCIIVAPNGASYDNLNNYSIVIKIEFGSNSFLFTGDAEALSEMEMVRKGYNLKSDVLKVGHHGSKSSTCENFLKSVSPKYAVISCGRDNKYGHPHKSTMDRLKSKSIPVYRTDECGTVVATSDGNKISFSTKQGSYLYRGTGVSTNNNKNSSTSIKKSKGNIKKADKAKVNTKINQNNPKVYIVGNGKKYHAAGCRHLHGKGKGIPLKDAKVNGYTPCKVCHPPQ